METSNIFCTVLCSLFGLIKVLTILPHRSIQIVQEATGPTSEEWILLLHAMPKFFPPPPRPPSFVGVPCSAKCGGQKIIYSGPSHCTQNCSCMLYRERGRPCLCPAEYGKTCNKKLPPCYCDPCRTGKPCKVDGLSSPIICDHAIATTSSDQVGNDTTFTIVIVAAIVLITSIVVVMIIWFKCKERKEEDSPCRHLRPCIHIFTIINVYVWRGLPIISRKACPFKAQDTDT